MRQKKRHVLFIFCAFKLKAQGNCQSRGISSVYEETSSQSIDRKGESPFLDSARYFGLFSSNATHKKWSPNLFLMNKGFRFGFQQRNDSSVEKDLLTILIVEKKNLQSVLTIFVTGLSVVSSYSGVFSSQLPMAWPSTAHCLTKQNFIVSAQPKKEIFPWPRAESNNFSF